MGTAPVIPASTRLPVIDFTIASGKMMIRASRMVKKTVNSTMSNRNMMVEMTSRPRNFANVSIACQSWPIGGCYLVRQLMHQDAKEPSVHG